MNERYYVEDIEDLEERNRKLLKDFKESEEILEELVPIGLAFSFIYILKALWEIVSLPFILRQIDRRHDIEISTILSYQHPNGDCPRRNQHHNLEECICDGELVNHGDGRGLVRVYR